MPQRPFEDLSVVVTGTNRGIGFALVGELAQEGANVVAVVRGPETADALRELNCRVEMMDISDNKSVAQFADRLDRQMVDILINNAGIGLNDDGLEKLSLQDVALHFEVNCVGTLRVIQALLPHIRRGRRKLVVNITSRLGSISRNTEGTGYGYRASKAALNMLNKNLSIELGKEGLSFVLLHPGWVRTDMGGPKAPLSAEESAEAIVKVIERLGQGDNGHFLGIDGQLIPW
jgi:NAD(P)-dependent dehydrogenase (short-subunit alcohol dehydrogenase family)